MVDREDLKTAACCVGLGLFSLLGFGVAYAYGNETKLRRMEIEASYPPEYWEAKKLESEADIRKHAIDVESHERLVLDKRNRATDAEKERLEFERNAPEEYWTAKAIKEQERTKRELNEKEIEARKEMNRRQVQLSKARLDMDRDMLRRYC